MFVGVQAWGIASRWAIIHPTNVAASQLVLDEEAEHISLSQLLQASSERFRSHLPLEPRPMNWNDAMEAAYRMKAQLGVSQSSWSEACQLLGRVGATLCVLLTDRAIDRTENPVRQPAAYFRGMVNRARVGELRLHNSIFGLLDQLKSEGGAA